VNTATAGRRRQVSDVRVLIVATDPLARAGLAALLAEQPGCATVGQVPVYRPDVLLWDLGWDPEPAPSIELRTGLDCLADLEDIALPVLALLPDEADAADAWSAGARGLLLCDADTETLVAALIARRSMNQR